MNLRPALLWTVDTVFAMCVVVGGACMTVRGLLLGESTMSKPRRDPFTGGPEACRACGKPLLPENVRMADGCPCNSARGINHGLVAVHVCTCRQCDPAQTGSTRAEQRPN